VSSVVVGSLRFLAPRQFANELSPISVCIYDLQEGRKFENAILWVIGRTGYLEMQQFKLFFFFFLRVGRRKILWSSPLYELASCTGFKIQN